MSGECASSGNDASHVTGFPCTQPWHLPQDRISLDGAAPPGIVPGVGGAAQSKLLVKDNPTRSVTGEYNGERIVGRAWPAADNHLVLLELHQ